MGVMVLSDPEVTAAWIKDIREKVEAKGRIPSRSGSPATSRAYSTRTKHWSNRMLDHDFSHYHASIWGRINQRDWEREGLPAPMGADWHYAEELLPVRIDEAEAQDIIGRSTRAHVEKSYLYGSPAKVAEDLQPFIDAGISWVGILDVLPMLLDPEDAARGTERQIEACGHIKARNSSSGSPASPIPAM